MSVCQICGTEREPGTRDHSLFDVFQGGEWGWASHPDEGEFCGPCMKAMFVKANSR